MADAIRGGIVINEILVDPVGSPNFDTDGNGTARAIDEYVELYNASGAAIDIGGLQLWDQGKGNWFTIPSGTILAAGAHALIMAGVQAGGSLPTGAPGDLFFDAGRTSASINNGGDNVVIYDPLADEYISAQYSGDAVDDPTASYTGFSTTATQIGSGEDFGTSSDGVSVQRTGDGSDTFNTLAPSPGTTNVCFVQGTMIATSLGPVAVEDLRQGTLLCTKDDGLQPLQWICHSTHSIEEITADPRRGCVRIAPGALGGDLPEAALFVSRQHRILVRSRIVERMFDVPEVLVAAKDMLAAPGISMATPRKELTYYHLLLPRHSVIFANGAPAESLLTATGTLEALTQAALDDLVRTQPESAIHAASVPARPIALGAKARRMIERHRRNGMALYGQRLALETT